jgi:hypothetical protein
MIYHDALYTVFELRSSSQRSVMDLQGLVLPFGAFNAHHNLPNPLLFFHDKWLLDGGSDPLQGWNLREVVEARVQHKVPLHDIYGAHLQGCSTDCALDEHAC